MVTRPHADTTGDDRSTADRLLSESLIAAAAKHPGRPRAALRAMGHAYRTFAVTHPDLYSSLLPPTPPPVHDPDVVGVGAEPVDLGASMLGQLGVPPDRQIHLLRTYAAMLHGFAVLELSGGFGAGDVDESFETALDQVLAIIDANAKT